MALHGWWRRRSLRARVTLASTAGLALALAAAAVLLSSALRVSLIRSLDNSARQGAREVAALSDANRLPNPVPVVPGTITVQVLSSNGQIVNVSPDADRLVPLLPPAVAAANARDGRAVFLNGRPFGLPDTVRVATAATAGGGTVIAAVAYNQVGESLATLTRALLIGTPLLLALLAAASWLIAGSTLRPVTELRRGAAGHHPDRPAPGPPGPGGPRRGAQPGADPERHAQQARRGPGTAARADLRHRARAAEPDRQHPGPAGGGAGPPGQPGLAADRRRRAARTRSGWPGWPRTCWPWPGWTNGIPGAPRSAGWTWPA